MTEAMCVITRRDIIRQVPAQFERQYGHARAISSWKGNVTHGEMIDALNALDTETCTAEAVNEIIGNKSWTDNECDVCGENKDALLRMGDEPDYEAHWWDICGDCLSKASDFLSQSPKDQS